MQDFVHEQYEILKAKTKTSRPQTLPKHRRKPLSRPPSPPLSPGGVGVGGCGGNPNIITKKPSNPLTPEQVSQCLTPTPSFLESTHSSAVADDLGLGLLDILVWGV